MRLRPREIEIMLLTTLTSTASDTAIEKTMGFNKAPKGPLKYQPKIITIMITNVFRSC